MSANLFIKLSSNESNYLDSFPKAAILKKVHIFHSNWKSPGTQEPVSIIAVIFNSNFNDFSIQIHNFFIPFKQTVNYIK